MIRLTSFINGSSIYVPADVVIKENYKYEYGSKNALPVTEYKPIDGAMVVYDGIEYAVKEPPEEVARKVLEWKLAMADYQDSSGEYRQMMRETLEELAGLHGKKLDAFIKRMEEPNHDT